MIENEDINQQDCLKQFMYYLNKSGLITCLVNGSFNLQSKKYSCLEKLISTNTNVVENYGYIDRSKEERDRLRSNSETLLNNLAISNSSLSHISNITSDSGNESDSRQQQSSKYDFASQVIDLNWIANNVTNTIPYDYFIEHSRNYLINHKYLNTRDNLTFIYPYKIKELMDRFLGVNNYKIQLSLSMYILDYEMVYNCNSVLILWNNSKMIECNASDKTVTYSVSRALTRCLSNVVDVVNSLYN